MTPKICDGFSIYKFITKQLTLHMTIVIFGDQLDAKFYREKEPALKEEQRQFSLRQYTSVHTSDWTIVLFKELNYFYGL